MAYGGPDKYYNPNNKVVNDGDVARADDLNSINFSTDAAFEQVANDLDNIILDVQEEVELARRWAEEDEDIVVADGGYSSYHWSKKAQAYVGTVDANYILTRLLTVDGTGSGVDADLLDGLHGSSYALLDSPALIGTPTSTTPAVDTNSTRIATTAYVLGQGGTANPVMNGAAAPGTSTRFSKQDHVHPTDTTRAPLASPALTGTPTSTTAAQDTNNTQIATTAFVIAQGSASNPLMNGTAAPGTSLRFSKQDHVHPTDTSRAPLASPALTGTPTAPTAAVDTNNTQVATTAFVIAQGGSTNPLMNGAAAPGTSTRLSKQDHVHPVDTSRAPLASPGLTGTPTAPTPTAGDNTTKIATTAFVNTAITNKVDRTSASGAIVTPSGTTAERPAGSDKYIRYNSDLNGFEGYNGSSWGSLGGGATGGAADKVFIENDQVVTTNYTITSGKSAVSTGPITVNAGVIVTVPSGSRWVIL